MTDKQDQPTSLDGWDGVDLCTGAGLFAEGAKSAGVRLRLCIDINTYTARGKVSPLGAVETSQAAGHPAVVGDIGDLSLYAGLVSERAAQECPPPLIVFGGPPCQPFSTAGKREGAKDNRDAFPAALQAIDLLQPDRVVLENVRGMLSHTKGCAGKGMPDADLQADYLPYLDAQDKGCAACYLHRHLIPELRKRFAHAGHWLIDAANMGVPQRRWRVFIWAADVALTPPAPTHSAESLVRSKWVDGSYWVEHGLATGGDGVVAEMHRGRSGPGGGTQAEATSVECPSVTISGAPGGSTRPQISDRGYPTPMAKWEQRVLKKGCESDLKRWQTMRDILPALQSWATETHTNDTLCRTPRSPDTPGLSPVAGGNAMGGMLGYFTDTKRPPGVERIGTCDEPVPAIANSGNRYIEAIGGGRNPSHESASPRSFRSLTDGPSVSMTAVQIGNRGPFLQWAHVGDPVHGCPKHPDRSVDTPSGTVRATESKMKFKALEPERLDAPSPTVTTTEVKGTRATSTKPMNGGPDRASDALHLATGRRRLTTAECALIQGAHPDYPWYGNKTQQYRQIGNAVPPALGEAVISAAISPRPLLPL